MSSKKQPEGKQPRATQQKKPSGNTKTAAPTTAKSTTSRPKSSHPAAKKQRTDYNLSNSMIHSKDRTYSVITGIFIFLTVCLLIWMVKLMVLDQEDIQATGYDPRLNEEQENVLRGPIMDASGDRLAYTQVLEDGTRQRVYPYGEAFAHVTGYIGRGQAGLELAASDTLLKMPNLLNTLQSWAREETVQGVGIVTTLDGNLQRYIYEQLAGYRGAVVITEPSTGKIKALVSSPSFDPATIVDDWETIANREDSPLYARATQGLYAPGSTFKILTALTMYRTMSDYGEYSYTCDGAYEVGDLSIACAHGNQHGTVQLEEAFAYSCNGFFAGAGLKMGAAALQGTAQYLRMGDSFDFILPQSESAVSVDAEDSDGLIAQTAIGQGETAITPFMMNMLTCAIAGEGTLYKPYLIDSTVDGDGKQEEKFLPQLWGSLMSPKEATFLENLMGGVTSYGTASELASDSYSIYGKTGTAQVDDGEDHSWFTGYTKVGGQTDIAITVVIENGGSDKKAVPLVQQILQQYYQ